MKRLLNNEKGIAGGILVSIAAVIIAVTASAAFMNLVQMDTNEVHYLQDQLQQELLLRSEIKRINILLENNSLMLPTRVVEMQNKNRIQLIELD